MRKTTSGKQLNNIERMANDPKSLAEYKATLIKSRRVIISTMVVTLAMMITLVASTIAWFANNRRVNNSDVAVNIQVSGNLVIAKTAEEIPNLPGASLDDAFALTFENEHLTLIPSRHKEGSGYPVNLEYNTNPKAVSAASGIAIDDSQKPLTFGAVPKYIDDDVVNDPRRFYYEYEVYVAAVGASMHADRLITNISLTPTEDKNGDGKIDENDIQDYLHALSVDFYIRKTISGDFNYVGTLNQIGLDWQNTGTPITELDLAQSKGIDIPLNTSMTAPYITVLLRCYFDGGLNKTNNQTYVYSNDLSTTGYTLSINFSAEEASN